MSHQIMSLKLKTLFEKNQKKMMILPILMIVVSFIFLITTYTQTGDLIDKDVSLSGGMTLTLYTEQTIDQVKLENSLKQDFSEISIRKLSEFGTNKEIGVVIETPEINEESIKLRITEATGIILTEENLSIEVVGSSLGDSFYSQMMKALIFAFIFMSLTILITFRKIVPSLAVVIVALGDLTITLSILNLMGMKLSSAGIAALLLLVGYSIDTDVLLTTRVLKNREGTIWEGVLSSMKTGLTMTITTISALGAAYLVSTSLVLKQMFAIIIIGLLIDVILTYMLNAPMLSLYAKKEGGK
jgi:preprotein translocase subunit SecF